MDQQQFIGKVYLTAPELAELLSCEPNQFAIMARRLTAANWPFDQVKGCCPKVLRSYHDQRMKGAIELPAAASNAPEYTPNRAALLAHQQKTHARKRKAA
jgi:hypothetical protein